MSPRAGCVLSYWVVWIGPKCLRLLSLLPVWSTKAELGKVRAGLTINLSLLSLSVHCKPSVFLYSGAALKFLWPMQRSVTILGRVVSHMIFYYITLTNILYYIMNIEKWQDWLAGSGSSPSLSPPHSRRGSWRQTSLSLQWKCSGTEEFLSLMRACVSVPPLLVKSSHNTLHFHNEDTYYKLSCD